MKSKFFSVGYASLFVCLGACRMLAGFDDRAPMPEGDADDGSVSKPTSDSGPLPLQPQDDTDADAEGGTGDASRPDASGDADADGPSVPSTINCSLLKASTCTAAKPYCSIHYDNANSRHTFTCVSSAQESTAPGAGASCGAAPLECGDGLACGYEWSGINGGYQCAPVCKTSTDCPSERPFCNHSLIFGAGVSPVSVCERCDTVLQTDCTGTNNVCIVTHAKQEPSCGTVQPTAGVTGASCTGASGCKAGYVCACPSVSGLGDDCAAASDGTCRRSCYYYNRGSACPAGPDDANPGVCGAAATGSTLYSYCK